MADEQLHPIKTPTHRFRVIRPGDAPQAWDDFVRSHPHGSVFHTAGMCRAFNQTRKYRSLALAAQDDSGKIQAMIAPVRVDAISSLTRALTSRAVMFAEPLCSPEPESAIAVRRLLSRHDSNVCHSTLYTEVRSMHAAVKECPILEQANYKPHAFLNYVIDLSQSKEQLWRNVGKQMRGNIRRSFNRGVEIDMGNSPELQRRAYAQIHQSLRRAMVPCPSSQLFEAVCRELGGVLQVRVAHIHGRDVAGTISLAWGDRFFAWYGGTNRPRCLHPFACIVWDEIQWAHDHGLQRYDFGGAGEPNRYYGPREFKSRFHGDLVQIGRCRKVYSPRLLALAQRGYDSLKSIANSV